MVDPGLDVGRVQVHVGHGNVVEPPGAEHCHLLVDAGTDPRHRRLRHSGLAAQRPDKVVDLPSGGAGRVGGHDHAPQGLVDSAAGFEQRGEERPDPHLRDQQLNISCRGRQQPGSGAVALVRSGVRAFVRRGADRCGELGVDQLLHAGLEEPTEQLLAVPIAQARQQVSNSGIIVMGHRVFFLPVSAFAGLTKDHAMAHPIRGTASLLPPHHGTPTAGTVPAEDLVLPAADGGGEATEFDDVGCAAVRVEAFETTACPAFRRRGVHLAQQLLFGEVGGADLTGGIARRQPCLDAGPAPVGQPLVSDEQLAADPIERLALAAPVAQGFLLYPTADLADLHPAPTMTD